MLELLICMLINFNAVPDEQTAFEGISLTVAILVSIIFLMFLGLLFVIAVKDSDPERNQDKLPLAYIDTLYLGMNNKRRNSTNGYLISSTLRTAIYAIVVI